MLLTTKASHHVIGLDNILYLFNPQQSIVQFGIMINGNECNISKINYTRSLVNFGTGKMHFLTDSFCNVNVL